MNNMTWLVEPRLWRHPWYHVTEC